MFRLLGKINNIATQLTLLVAVVAGLAIVVVSWASVNRSQALLLRRAKGSLADEGLLRSFALREAVRSLSREVRDRADALDRALRGGVEASREQALERIFTSSVEREDRARGVMHEVCLVQVPPKGAIYNLHVLRAAHQGHPRSVSLTPATRTQPTNPAVAEVWKRLTEVGPSRQAVTRQFLSPLKQDSVEDELEGIRPYLLAISYSLPHDPGKGISVLIITVNFTHLVESQARRLPRHLLFVHAKDNTWAYHPDPSQIGKEVESWVTPSHLPEERQENDSQREPQRGVLLEVPTLPSLQYYTLTKPLDSALTHKLEACRELEEELADSPELRSLRFSPLWDGAPSIELSSRDPAVLDKALKKIELSEKRVRSKHAPGRPRPILCQHFIGHYLHRRYLDADNTVPIGVVLAAAEEEMTAEVHSAILNLWYRWFLPVLLASAALALISAYIITRPLRRLTEASQRLAQGDYSVEVEVLGPGEVGELAQAFRDMTERIHTRERELRENLARLNTILTNAADGIITFDQTGRIEQANAVAEEMFGAGPGGLTGTKVQKLMKLPEHLQKPVAFSPVSPGPNLAGKEQRTGTGSSIPPFGGTVTQLFNAVKTPGEEHRGLRQDGGTFWMEVTFSQVPLDDRRLITGIFRDVTQRKLAEERIKQMNDELDARVRLRTAQLEDAKIKLELALAQAESASAAKDRFISVVSHELRTPLTSAMGYTELLLNPRATKLRENPTPTLEKILTSCKHLLTLINDLLDVGRYTAGKPIDLSPTRFELTSFLKGVQEMVTPLVKKNGNVLETVIAEHLGESYNDETRLRQILLNLLSNASKFTEKGKIGLEVERLAAPGGDTLVFRVRDTGAGMTSEQMEKLFTPFYRVDNSTTRRHGGTGLGLTITRMLCELMGGSISVESKPGQGSTFTVRLPAELSTIARKGSTQGTNREGRPVPSCGTVLVIDDDATIRQMLETYLQQEGYQVVLASNGEEGLRLAREFVPTCITLDVLMPNEDGWNVLGRLKNDPVTRDIPVIMLTIMEERNRGFALGATEYVTKPIDWGRLGSILCRYNPGQAPILVVEDDALQRGYLREELLLAGWTVLEASNGQEALKVCESMTPSLILLDLTMPIMDGFTFLDELRRKDKGADIPVVVVTARELSHEERERLNRSVAQVLAKGSLSKDQLLERISEQMRAAAQEVARTRI